MSDRVSAVNEKPSLVVISWEDEQTIAIYRDDKPIAYLDARYEKEANIMAAALRLVERGR